MSEPTPILNDGDLIVALINAIDEIDYALDRHADGNAETYADIFEIIDGTRAQFNASMKARFEGGK